MLTLDQRPTGIEDASDCANNARDRSPELAERFSAATPRPAVLSAGNRYKPTNLD
jgi:hypothetical protein